MLKPRPYQQEAVDLAIDFFKSKSKKKPIIVAPTGSGKSIIIAFITKRLKENVLILQPSKELLLQNYEKFTLCGGEASIYSASVGQKEIGKVTFATIGSIVKKPELFLHKEYVIIDECHNVPPKKDTKKTVGSMYMKFLSKIDAKVIGLTATAFRNKQYMDEQTYEVYTQINLLTRERPKYFNEFLHVTQISEMYEQGFLAPIKWIELEWSNERLKLNSTGAEFTEKSTDQALDINKVNKRLPNIVSDALRKGRKHILVFVKQVYHAEELVKRTPRSAYVSSKTKKKERAEIIQKFKSGEIDVVYNVSVLTTGFDFPALDTVILARPTGSLQLYMQMVGRGIRLHESKEYCAVLDMCGNHNRFGKIENMRLVEEEDPYTLKTNWVFRNDEKILSGVKLEF